MAYNFYNLGITGTEIKRRLDMLDGIAGVDENNQKITVANTKQINDIIKMIGETKTELENKIETDIIIALNIKNEISHIDAGIVTDLISK